jgi:hypothetical protein
MNPLQFLKQCKTFADFLRTVRDEHGYELCHDNGWSWVEYKGKEIEGTAKERFTSSRELDTLLNMAMHDTFYVVKDQGFPGAIIGVADSPQKAVDIYVQRYGELPEKPFTAYKLNKLHI